MKRIIFTLTIVVGACTSASTQGGPSADGTVAVAATHSLVCWSSQTGGVSGPVVFVDSTEDFNLVESLIGIRGHAAAVGDINDDDFPDLVVGTFADRPIEDYAVRGADGPNPDRLFVTEPELVLVDGWSEELARTSGALFADLDADGDDDLVLIRHAGVGGNAEAVSRLFENDNGMLEFRKEILPAGFRGRTPTVADFDSDGLLDLYVSEDRYGSTGGLVLHNEGDFEFVDETAGSGLEAVFSLGARAADLNADGRPDLVLSTGVYTNNGSLTFKDETPDGYVTEPVGDEDDPAGVAVGDLNGDGRPDIVVGQHFRSTVEFDALIPIRVFLSDSAGDEVNFVDITESSGIRPFPTLAPHVHIVDMNNDSLPDIVTSSSVDDGTLPAVFINRGGEPPQFEISGSMGGAEYWVGAPVLDIDRDGRLDIFAIEWEPSLRSLMFLNESESGHWLEVSVSGASRGVGSVITVETEDGDLIGRQEIGIATGYSSAHQPIAHFGLGAHERVQVQVKLADGQQHNLGLVEADRHIRWPNGCG
jgi:hypothetical protein